MEESGSAFASAVDVNNLANDASRWSEALGSFSAQQLGQERSSGSVVLSLLIDVSGSMRGTKLVSSKLGICAVVSTLADDDVINITTFASRTRGLTGGFQRVGDVRAMLPGLLADVEADGGTACFDAAIAALTDMRAHANTAVLNSKSALILLTDGVDTNSRHSSSELLLSLSSPGLSRFMFVLVAVQMEAREEQEFESLASLRHCKQISVSVRTGARLLAVFQETLMSRVLHTPADNARFYQPPPPAAAAQSADESTGLTTAMLLLHQERLDAMAFEPEGRLSRNVSRANSDAGSDEGHAGAYEGFPNETWVDAGSTSPVLRARGGLGIFDRLDGSSGMPEDLIVDEMGPPTRRLQAPSREAVNLAGVLAGLTHYSRPRSSSAGSAGSGDDTFSSAAAAAAAASCMVVDGVTFPPECLCPLTHEVFSDPVMAADGHSYERGAIESWLRRSRKSPLSGNQLASLELTPNHALRSVIDTLRLTGAGVLAVDAEEEGEGGIADEGGEEEEAKRLRRDEGGPL